MGNTQQDQHRAGAASLYNNISLCQGIQLCNWKTGITSSPRFQPWLTPQASRSGISTNDHIIYQHPLFSALENASILMHLVKDKAGEKAQASAAQRSRHPDGQTSPSQTPTPRVGAKPSLPANRVNSIKPPFF